MYMERKNFSATRSQGGFSIVGVIIAAGIVGTISVFLMDQILTATRAQLSVEKRLEVSGIKQRLMFEIDCANTMAGINPATDCSPTNYIPLRNKANAVIGFANGTGSFANSRQIEGQWFVRGTCTTAPNASLEVQVALQGSNPATFGKDPMTRQDLNWTNKKGTIFGGDNDETTFCSTEVGGAGPPPPPPSAWTSGNLVGAGGCQSNYVWGDDGNDEVRNYYAGTVNCPPGLSAVSGSVDCGAGRAQRVQHSHVTAAGDGWAGGCCSDGAYDGTGKIKVLCQ